MMIPLLFAAPFVFKIALGIGAATVAATTVAAIASSPEDNDKNNASAKTEEQERRKARRRQKESDCRQAREDVMRRLKNLAAFIEESDIPLQFENVEKLVETKSPDDFCHSMAQHIDNGLDQLPLNQCCGDTSYTEAWERFQRMDMLRAKICQFAENMESISD